MQARCKLEVLTVSYVHTPHHTRSRLACACSVGHLHTGAINISMYHNGRYVCTSYPTYGNETDVPGNERGHLVGMTTCMDKDTSGYVVDVKAGDSIRLDAYYWVGSEDARIAPSPAGSHLNVMAYMYVVFDIADEESADKEPTREEKHVRMAAAGSGCTPAIAHACGQLVGTGAACVDCAHENLGVLVRANCSVEHVEATCQGKVASGSNVARALPQSLPPFTW